MRHSDPRLTMNLYAHVGSLPTPSALANVRVPAITSVDDDSPARLENVAERSASSGSRSVLTGRIGSRRDRVRDDADTIADFGMKYERIVLSRRALSPLDLLWHSGSDTVEKAGPRSSVG